jgi:hypothetical protein
VRYHRAQDTFVADLKDGTSIRVVKGDVLPEGHELVKRDLDAAAAAAKASTDRVPLFRPLDSGEEDPVPKSPAARVAAKVTGKAA